MALKNREKILLLLGLIAVSFYIFDLIYYTPRSRKIRGLEGELKAAELKLQELALLTKGMETINEKVKKLEDELRGLSEKTVKGDEFRSFLNHLAKESDPISMKIVSIKPLEEEIFNDQGGFIKNLKKVRVNLVLHSTFYKLENYLKGIEKLPYLIDIDDLQVERIEEIYPLLKATLLINLYILF